MQQSILQSEIGLTRHDLNNTKVREGWVRWGWGGEGVGEGAGTEKGLYSEGCDKYLLNFKTSLTSYQPSDDFRPMDSSAYENLDIILF